MSDSNDTAEIIKVPKSNNECAPIIKKYLREDGSYKFNVIIEGMIEQSIAYVELAYELNHATEKDEFDIYIQSNGGFVSGGCFVAGAIHSSKAKTTCIANGVCASSATTILVAAKHIKIRDFARVMFHMSLHGDGGNSVGILERAIDIIEFMKYILNLSLKRGLITEDEFDRIVNKKEDVFIPTDELQRRLNGGN